MRLMNRTTRKLSLTEAGEAYYREASQLLQQLDDLDATISDQTAEPRGMVRVSAPRNLGENDAGAGDLRFHGQEPAGLGRSAARGPLRRPRRGRDRRGAAHLDAGRIPR